MSVAERVLGRRYQETRVVCPADDLEFTPIYTEGVCPLCGWKPEDLEVELPLAIRLDRFWLAVAIWGAASILMLVLVVIAYTRG